MESAQVRTYGTAGPYVVVVHGGPGAPGSMRPVARRLSDSFRVIEPLQRDSGGEPLTVARHVADLREIVLSRCAASMRPALVGASWGAMLVLAYAAAHPSEAGPLVLIGCGTFDRAARRRLHETLDERATPELTARLQRVEREAPDSSERIELLMQLYSYEPESEAEELFTSDARAMRETWEDMVRLQDEGIYPAAFAAIHSPVLMLHGDFDPHPGPMIRASLEPVLPQLEYRELKRCGHEPWREKWARVEFFSALRSWLGRHS